jgi:penicillin-binding protein 2
VAAPETSETSQLRLTVLLVVVGCLFVALIARLWSLQVINTAAAKEQVQTTGLERIYTPAPRGEILDREGDVLVDNISVPVIEVQQQQAGDTAMVTRLAALLGLTLKALTAAIDNDQYSPIQYVPVYEDASAAQILYVQEHQALFPDVLATTLSEPHVTPLGEYAGAILGYVGPIDAAQLKEKEYRGYEEDAQIGIGGVEQEFESELRGTPGVQTIQVNGERQDLGTVAETAPVPGHNIRLSIDGPLQELAVKAMEQGEVSARSNLDPVTKRRFTAPGGSVVATDPRNGQLLALATDPTYDPNLFDNGGISESNYAKLAPCAGLEATAAVKPTAAHTAAAAACNQAHPQDPLEDRAIQGEYAPGSTFKLTTATAGLLYPQYTNVTPSWVYDDTGSIQLGDGPANTLHDDDDIGSGPVDLARAITVSSDDYFYEIGVKLWEARARVGETAMQKVEEGYGFGEATGIDLPDESTGVIPTPSLYALQKKEYPTLFSTGTWFSGDSAHTAIGQGQVLVTPLQLVDAYAAFANGGTRYAPQIALDAETASGRVVKRYGATVEGHAPALSAPDRQAMLQGFEGVVNDPTGTAYGDFAGTPLAKDDIAGKTGTAQVTGAGKQNTSVFASFAPATAPTVAIDCVMEDAGYGASLAAPIVRTLYEQLYHDPITPVVYEGTVSGAQN